MSKAILICGKICSGKTKYAKDFIKNQGGVLLSCDQIMLTLFDEQLGDKHDIILGKTKKYLIELGKDILSNGTDIVLDWGFWTERERKYYLDFFVNNGFNAEIHYVKINESNWDNFISSRNSQSGNNYKVSDTLKKMSNHIFQEPINYDVIIKN